MVIDCSTFDGPCSCGRDHSVETRLLVIERGCLARLDTILADAGIGGPRVAVYDTNTYKAIGSARPEMDKEIVLDADGLHADEAAAEALMSSLDGKKATLFAMGAGTVTDVVRYCAGLVGSDFVSCPTAASVDGFCSSVAAMTMGGFKTTVKSRAPLLVVADLNVIARAPLRLTRSGIGDLFGKYVSLADWKVAALVAGERMCSRISGLVADAVSETRAVAQAAVEGEVEAIGRLVKGLLLSGLAMQMSGDSRPASGAEHHVSHLLELGVPSIGGAADALHGEKVGVGTVLVSALYRRMIGAAGAAPAFKASRPIDEEWAMSAFGERLGPSIIRENRDDCLNAIEPGRAKEAWAKVRETALAIPGPEELSGLYAGLGMKVSLSDLGVDPSLEDSILELAPYVRNRVTLARMRRLL